MRALILLAIYTKRRLKSLGFVATALIIPILACAAAGLSGEEAAGFKTGFYCENKEISSALEAAEGVIEFIGYESTEELTRAVEANKLNCGYILPEDTYTALKENKNGTIVCLKSPSTAGVSITNEGLFSCLARLYADDIAREYMQENSIAYDENKLAEYYEGYLKEGKAIAVEYSFIEGGKTEEAANSGFTLGFDIQGLLALYIMLGGILGINLWLKDEEKGIPLGVMNVVSGILLLSLCSAVAAAITGGFSALLVLRLALYAVFLTGYCVIIKLVFGKPSVICGLLPVLIIGSLVFCPVFADITALLPWLKPISYIFAPCYFTGRIAVLGVSAVCSAVICGFVSAVKP